MKKTRRLVLATLTVTLLAGPGVGCGPDENNQTENNQVENNQAENNQAENNDFDSSNAIEAADQTLEGDLARVTVARVVADVDGWVVIHADDDGNPGEVLGQVAVDAGESTDVEVELSRDVEDGETLHAMLHVDDPADGEYTFGEEAGQDIPAVGAGGEVVVASFVVSVEGAVITPAVEVEDQTADPANEVVIASVTAAEDGFIVIHEDDGSGSFGAVIGHAAVTAGENSDVVVTLDRDAVDGETLYAMLHVDDPADGEYTFDGMNGEDGPVLDADMNVIAPSFVVSVGLTPSVTVADQMPDPANEVVIASVTAAEDGFIVIHEDDGAGAPGAAIGHVAVTEGESADVVVTLDRDAVDGETLYAMLHADDGNGVYDDAATDPPVVDGMGDVIAPSFVVSLAGMPSVMVSDQTADPADEVVIAQAYSDGPGWLVVHEDDGSGSFGAVIGHAALADGVNTDVVVTLDRPVRDGETLYAMLHVDAPADGSYTFDGMNGEDGPVLDSNMDVIAPPFTVMAGTSEPFVTVEDQLADPASEVVIAQSIYADAGFIVIHEDDGAGSFGAAIGSAPIAAGVNQGVTVTLDRPAVNGETLYAMLHADDGNGTYDGPATDPPVTDGAGAVVTPTFVVSTLEPSVTVADQTLSNVSTIVSVGSAYALQDGFIVIHEDDGSGSFGAAIGSAPIAAGVNQGVTVTLDRPAVNGETLYAMLHADDGNGVYDDAATDPPVTNFSGAVVTAAFGVTVPTGTPAVRFMVSSAGTSGYLFTGATPAAYSAWISDPAAEDPTLTLQQGWRYQFDVTGAYLAHPIEFGDLSDMGAASDVIALSQQVGIDPAEESDAGIAWDDDGAGTVTFTLTPGFAATLDGYRCEVHKGSMRGDITILP